MWRSGATRIRCESPGRECLPGALSRATRVKPCKGRLGGGEIGIYRGAHCPVRTALSLADRTRVQGKAPPLRSCVPLPWMGEACPERPFGHAPRQARGAPQGAPSCETKGLGGGESWVSCVNPAYIVRRHGCGGGPAFAGIGTPSGTLRRSSQETKWTSRQTYPRSLNVSILSIQRFSPRSSR
jgi:hypothetical protein